MVKTYIPERGDVIWLDFTPHSGHEQSGRRPALVLSPNQYNSKVGLAICCPITSHCKGYPFEVLLPQNSQIEGVILADHVKNLDWRARKASFIEKTPNQTLREVVGKLAALIDIR